MSYSYRGECARCGTEVLVRGTDHVYVCDLCGRQCADWPDRVQVKVEWSDLVDADTLDVCADCIRLPAVAALRRDLWRDAP
ncbi:MAG TPA: hypothetical protein VF288_10710 [Mycobacteriales bacterium]